MTMTTAISTNKSVDHFLQRINGACKNGTKATLEKAAILHEALNTLSETNQSKLAELTKLSLATMSKYQKIYLNRSRLEKHFDDLPDGWTVLYPLCKLTDRQFKRLVGEGKLRRDLTASQIEKYSLGDDADLAVVDEESAAVALGDKKVSASEERSRDLEGKSRLIATIRAYGEVDDQGLSAKIEAALKPVLKGSAFKLEFPERKSAKKEKNRGKLATELNETLKPKLASYRTGRATLTKEQYQTAENAAWQHQQKVRTGRFPYEKTDPSSIEHPKHPYSITQKRFSSRENFMRWLRKEKIITPYNPIPENPDLGEESCIKFAIEYCEAKTAKARRIAKTALDTLVKSNSPKKKYAEKYLNLIERRGAL